MAATPQTSAAPRRRTYNAAFKATAVALARRSPTARGAARQLGISEKLLYRWQQAQGRQEAEAASALRTQNSQLAAPVMRAWATTHYAHPADQLAQGTALGRQLAAALLHTQGLYLYDHRAKQMLFVSPGIERLLGYPPEACNIEFLYTLIHPDDQAIVTEATVLVNRFVLEHLLAEPLDHLVFSVDYRLRHARGHWLRVLRQNIVVARDTNGAVVAVAGILTDISAHKRTHDVRFHFTHPGFADFVRRQQLATLPQRLSEREQQVLLLLLEGLSSQTIGERLFLHMTTVQTHRRNIRRKTKSHDLHHLLQHLDAETSH